MREMGLWGLPGPEHVYEWQVVLLFSLVWALNATLAATAAGRGWVVGFLVLDLLAGLWAEGSLGWRVDSGALWLWVNLVTSAAAPAGLVWLLRSRAGDAVVGPGRFWRMAWAAIPLVLVANGGLALLRRMALGGFGPPF